MHFLKQNLIADTSNPNFGLRALINNSKRFGGFLLLVLFSFAFITQNWGRVVAADTCPQGMSQLDCEAIAGTWVDWVPGECSSSAASGPMMPGAANGTSNSVSFDDSQSTDTGGVTTIDDDGIDPSPTGSPDHQSTTSYANGKLGALHTNYFALNPGWAKANGLVLGDVGTLTYKGKTVYAVYGDNHVGNTPHAEISVAAAMALTGITNPAKAENSLSGVHFTIYPGTHTQLNGSVDQNKINQIGAQASGGNPTTPPSAPSGCACSGGTTGFGTGTLPSYVKDPYNKIFTAAAAKYNIDPAGLVALFYNEQYGYQNSVSAFHQHEWPNPPPPYGSGVPWNNGGGAGAEGPFQFLPSTWTTEGVDGNGDGTADPNDLTDAAFGAAHYLSDGDLAVKITAGSSQSDFALAATHYYGDHSLDAYGIAAGIIYEQVRSDEGSGPAPTTVTTTPTPTTDCSPAGSSPTSGFTNPFPGGWIPNRLDMGYDGTFKGQIVAPCDGVITYEGPFNGWNGSLGVIIKCDNSIGFPVHSLYFTEGVGPIMGLQGKHVTAGTPIANPVPSPYGDAYGTTPDGSGQIEWGVSEDGPIGQQVNTYAIQIGFNGKCSPSAQSRAMVLQFYQWAHQTLQVGGPPTSENCAGAT